MPPLRSAKEMAMPVFARAQARRQRANFAIFLGPASSVLLLLFFVAPIVIDLVLAFTDMGRTLAVTRFTLENFERMASPRHAPFGRARNHRHFRGNDARYFQRHFCLAVGVGDYRRAATPRRVLSCGMAAAADEPLVVYALLWLRAIDPNERGLLNQIVVHVFEAPPVDLRNNHPLMVIILANGFIGASLGMLIFTSAIRSIPEHLFHAARVDGAGPLAIVRHITLPALRWPISYMTIHQTLSLLVSFEYILLITGEVRSTTRRSSRFTPIGGHSRAANTRTARPFHSYWS